MDKEKLLKAIDKADKVYTFVLIAKDTPITVELNKEHLKYQLSFRSTPREYSAEILSDCLFIG